MITPEVIRIRFHPTRTASPYQSFHESLEMEFRQSDPGIYFYGALNDYIERFPPFERKGRFIRYVQKGLGTNRVLGKNTIASFPKKIAQILQVGNAHLYNAKSFGRSSLTSIVDFTSESEDVSFADVKGSRNLPIFD
jgi:hypothetical protein